MNEIHAELNEATQTLRGLQAALSNPQHQQEWEFLQAAIRQMRDRRVNCMDQLTQFYGQSA